MRNNRTTSSLFRDPALSGRPLWPENKGVPSGAGKQPVFPEKQGDPFRDVAGPSPESIPGFGIIPPVSQEHGTCSYSSVPVAGSILCSN